MHTHPQSRVSIAREMSLNRQIAVYSQLYLQTNPDKQKKPLTFPLPVATLSDKSPRQKDSPLCKTNSSSLNVNNVSFPEN